jgi:electron transfer flavoprotein beta subunit
MKFAVCVKAIPGSASGRRLDAATGRLERDGELSVSPFDLHALELALALRDRDGMGEVVVVSLGPSAAADALLKTLAMGADRSILISDELYLGADLLVTAAALAAALSAEQPDLVLFGQQSPDGEGACLAAAVAEHLQLPVLSQLVEFELAGGEASGRRQTESGDEFLRAPLPALVAVTDSINQPRYPTLKGIVGAKAKPQQVLSAADLGGAHRARTSVLSLAPPAARASARLIHDDGSAAETIVSFLRERALL